MNKNWSIDLLNGMDNPEHLIEVISELFPIVLDHHATLVRLCIYHQILQLDDNTFHLSLEHVIALIDDYILNNSGISGPTSIITPFINDWSSATIDSHLPQHGEDGIETLCDHFLQMTFMVADAQKMKKSMLELARLRKLETEGQDSKEEDPEEDHGEGQEEDKKEDQKETPKKTPDQAR